MATAKRFEELPVWKESRELCQELFTEFLNNDNIRDWELKNQINRSSGSIMDNIAEGFERSGNRELIQFLSIAKASCGEVRSQLHRMGDRNYLSPELTEKFIGRTETIGKMLNGFIHYLKNTEYRGSKYKVEEPEIQYGNPVLNIESQILN